MASLQELLADEGFESTKRTPARTHRNVKFKDREDSNIALPIYICHDRRSSLISPRTNLKTLSVLRLLQSTHHKNRTTIFEGQRFSSEAIKEKCYACFLRKKNHHLDDGILQIAELLLRAERLEG
ncbi:hypothetical protein HAX54_036665 [Datura stramonium]|uniref:Uncharacterized protein n=1 Tax=Datura stramonium TaxID=4076 RepID=A0ABS8VI20_DATST|nr:hypothetical protein [Datura stramonium]